MHALLPLGVLQEDIDIPQDALHCYCFMLLVCHVSDWNKFHVYILAEVVFVACTPWLVDTVWFSSLPLLLWLVILIMFTELFKSVCNYGHASIKDRLSDRYMHHPKPLSFQRWIMKSVQSVSALTNWLSVGRVQWCFIISKYDRTVWPLFFLMPWDNVE